MARAMAGRCAGCARSAERRGVRRIAAVATSAVREAENGKAFVQRVRDEVGIPLRIIDADTEAALSWRSVAHHFRMASAPRPGGRHRRRQPRADRRRQRAGGARPISMPLGAVRLTEKYLNRGKDTRREVESLRKMCGRCCGRDSVAGMEQPGLRRLGRHLHEPRPHGRSGAAACRCRQRSTATSVPTGEVEQLLEWLCTRTAEQRRNVVPGSIPSAPTSSWPGSRSPPSCSTWPMRAASP